VRKQVLAAVSALVLLGGSFAPALAHNPRYSDRYYRNDGYRNSQSQYLKKAAIGGVAGAALGGVLSSEGYRADGALKGALLGAGVGLGYEYLRRNGIFSNNSRW
jgi:hypothetical protein